MMARGIGGEAGIIGYMKFRTPDLGLWSDSTPDEAAEAFTAKGDFKEKDYGELPKNPPALPRTKGEAKIRVKQDPEIITEDKIVHFTKPAVVVWLDSRGAFKRVDLIATYPTRPDYIMEVWSFLPDRKYGKAVWTYTDLRGKSEYYVTENGWDGMKTLEQSPQPKVIRSFLDIKQVFVCHRGGVVPGFPVRRLFSLASSPNDWPQLNIRRLVAERLLQSRLFKILEKFSSRYLRAGTGRKAEVEGDELFKYGDHRLVWILIARSFALSKLQRTTVVGW